MTHFAAICVSLLCTIGISAPARTITVATTDDSGLGSLRQALADANDGDTIDFDPALNGQIIMLTTAELATIDGFRPSTVNCTVDCVLHRTNAKRGRLSRMRAPVRARNESVASLFEISRSNLPADTKAL